MGDKKRFQIDEELVKGCQRYLDELERRSTILQKVKDEQKEVERQKSARREHWRRVLYGGDSPLTVVITDDSQLK